MVKLPQESQLTAIMIVFSETNAESQYKKNFGNVPGHVVIGVQKNQGKSNYPKCSKKVPAEIDGFKEQLLLGVYCFSAPFDQAQKQFFGAFRIDNESLVLLKKIL